MIDEPEVRKLGEVRPGFLRCLTVIAWRGIWSAGVRELCCRERIQTISSAQRSLIDVGKIKESVAVITDVAYLKREVRAKLMLNTEVVTQHVGVAETWV